MTTQQREEKREWNCSNGWDGNMSMLVEQRKEKGLRGLIRRKMWELKGFVWGREVRGEGFSQCIMWKERGRDENHVWRVISSRDGLLFEKKNTKFKINKQNSIGDIENCGSFKAYVTRLITWGSQLIIKFLRFYSIYR